MYCIYCMEKHTPETTLLQNQKESRIKGLCLTLSCPCHLPVAFPSCLCVNSISPLVYSHYSFHLFSPYWCLCLPLLICPSCLISDIPCCPLFVLYWSLPVLSCLCLCVFLFTGPVPCALFLTSVFDFCLAFGLSLGLRSVLLLVDCLHY